MNKKHDPNLTSALAGVCLLLGASGSAFAADASAGPAIKPLDHVQLWNAIVTLLSDPQKDMDVKMVESALHVQMKINSNPIGPAESYSAEAIPDGIPGIMLIIPTTLTINRWTLSFSWLGALKTSNYASAPRSFCVRPDQIEAEFTAAGWTKKSSFFPFQPSTDDIATASATFVKGTTELNAYLNRDGNCLNQMDVISQLPRTHLRNFAR